MVAWLLKCNISRLFYELQKNVTNNVERIFLVFKTDFLYHQNAHFILYGICFRYFQVYIIIYFFNGYKGQ